MQPWDQPTDSLGEPAFFIAAVALVLQVDDPAPGHYALLFAVSLGLWIVELRNRAIFDNLLRRALPGQSKRPRYPAGYARGKKPLQPTGFAGG
jgi:hypothetical protein